MASLLDKRKRYAGSRPLIDRHGKKSIAGMTKFQLSKVGSKDMTYKKDGTWKKVSIVFRVSSTKRVEIERDLPLGFYEDTPKTVPELCEFFEEHEVERILRDVSSL